MKRNAQQRADDLCALNHDLWLDIVHCENMYEPADETAKAFGVSHAVVRAIYAEQRRNRK